MSVQRHPSQADRIRAFNVSQPEQVELPPDDREPVTVEDPILREGFTQIPNGVLRDPRISTGAKVCYGVLLSYAWQKDRCFPGQDRLAFDIGVSVRSVRTYLRELEQLGIVLVEQRGLTRTNVYRLPRLIGDPRRL